MRCDSMSEKFVSEKKKLKLEKWETKNKNISNMTIDNNLWVFGYGSLCWHPGFDYGDQVKKNVILKARLFQLSRLSLTGN
jgi:hypothetical protein